MNVKIKLLKLTLVCGFLFFIGMQDAISKQIWSLETTNKGILGYSYTKFTQAEYNGHLGWVGICKNPGTQRCKVPSGTNGGLDATDLSTVDFLVENADLKIANGSRAGHATRTIQVQGESFKRVYRITWTATNILRRPGEFVGNGQTVNMSVERDDVNL